MTKFLSVYVCACTCECVCERVYWKLLSKPNFELEKHEIEWVEVIMGVAMSCQAMN